MIPAAFEYQRPATLDEALRAISNGGSGGVKVIAGGQSLLPLLKMPLASAEILVDIGRIAELKALGPTPDGGYEIGALATYADLIAATKLGWTAEAVEQIGDVQVRNRGTVGGSVAHCDPASDLPAIGLALDYSVVLRSSRGERVVRSTGSSRARSRPPWHLTSCWSSCVAARCRRVPPGHTGSWPRPRPGIRSSVSPPSWR